MIPNRRRILLPVLLTSLALFAAATSFAEGSQPRTHIGNLGYVDWLNMDVVGRGVGILPPDATDSATARAMAGRAATLDARRNLLEVIKNVNIDSHTQVVDFITQSDVIVSRLQGIIQGAEILDAQEMEDGSVVVEARLPLTGPLGRTLVDLAPRLEAVQAPAAGTEAPNIVPRLDSIEQRLQALENRLASVERHLTRKGTSPPPPDSSAAVKELAASQQHLAKELQAAMARIAQLEARRPTEPTPAATAQDPGYTSLVVDARDLGFRPSLRPEIHAQAGLLYPGAQVDPKVAATSGFVRYYQDMTEAQQSQRAGNLPLVVKAQDILADAPGALMLGSGDAAQVQVMMATPANPLTRGQVIIVF